MDFIDACKVVLRRWYVVLPLLVLTFAGTVLAYNSASARYTAKASLVLVVPTATPIEGATNASGEPLTTCDLNPWCARNDTLNLGNVTALRMTDPGIEKRLQKEHPGSTYAVTLSADNRSPIIIVSVAAPTPKEALATLDSVRAEVEEQVRQRQLDSQGVVEEGLITLEPVTVSIRADVQTGAMLRAALAAFGLGLVLTLGGAFLFESLARSRRDAKSPLLDRIAFPDAKAGAATTAKAEANAGSETHAAPDGEPAPTTGTRAPKPVTAAPPRSGRVGS